MPVISGEAQKLTSEQGATSSLEEVPVAWPLGRMVLVVFVICLAIWGTLILYLLRR